MSASPWLCISFSSWSSGNGHWSSLLSWASSSFLSAHVLNAFGDYSNWICETETLRKPCFLSLRDFKNHSKKEGWKQKGCFCCGVSQVFDECHQVLCPVTSTLGWTWPRPMGLPSWPGSGRVRPSPGGKVLPCPALGSPLAPSSPALREQLALAAPWQRALVDAIWFLLFCLSLPRNAVDLLKRSFCTVPFGFSLHVSCYCMKQSNNYLFSVSPYPFFSGGIHEWKRKNISLSLSCKRKGSLYTLSQLCPCARAGHNQVLFLKSLLQFSIS